MNLFLNIIRHPIFLIAGIGFLLGGCVGHVPGSVAGGECKVFHDPGFAVRGKRLKDSQWIGRTQETGIRVCHWLRPRGVAPSPVASSPVAVTVALPPVVPTTSVVTPRKKRHWWSLHKTETQ